MKSTKGAMEMSVGTIVTIVLLMSVLVLGLFLVQKVFSSGTSAVDAIDDQVQNEITKLFVEEGRKLAVFPNSLEITLKKGDAPKGFAFSINNKGVESATYVYEVSAVSIGYDYVRQCGSGMSAERANGYLLLDAGTIELGPGSSMERAELVKFKIPESAPPCTIPYQLSIEENGVPYDSVKVYVTIK